jgi:hypothetical protein
MWTPSTNLKVLSLGDGDRIFFKNLGHYVQSPDVATQKTYIDIFMAVRISDLE